MNSNINRAIDEELANADRLLLAINRKTDEVKNYKSKTFSKNNYDEIFDIGMRSKSNISKYYKTL
jgi:hypothetical protein